MTWVDEQHQLIGANRKCIETSIGRIERHHAKVEASLRHLDSNLTRGNAPYVDQNFRMLLAELLDERQEDVHAALVRTDEHPAALQISQFADRQLRLLRQTLKPFCVVAQHAPGFGERSVLGRTIEEPLADLLFQTP